MRPVGDDLGGLGLKILIATDVFPPNCGGAGWSAYYLARALRARGHTVAVVRPCFVAAPIRPTLVRTAYDGLPVAELHLPAAGPSLRRLWTRNITAPRRLRRLIATEARRLGADLIHAQHALTVVAAVASRQSSVVSRRSAVGGRGWSAGVAALLAAPVRRWPQQTARHIPVVATVRDYWPLCYYSTMQVPGRQSAVGSRQSAVGSRQSAVGSELTSELRTQNSELVANPQSAIRNPQSAGGRQSPVAGKSNSEFRTQNSELVANPQSAVAGVGLWPLARTVWRAQGWGGLRWWPLLPAWEWATARRRAALRRADATVAVSRFVAGRLRAGGAVAAGRLHVIPNLVDLPHVAEIVAQPAPLEGIGLTAGQPFLLFVGKLEVSKGAWLLPAALRAAGVGGDLPVVIAGSGPLQATLAAQAQAAGLDFRCGFWPNGDDVLRLLRAATVLLFPSAWDEPLTRVLLEACAVGATILALDTGGTSDILTDGVDGRLVADMDAFAVALRGLLADPAEQARLAAGAQATARARFSAEVVGAQVEALYRSLL